MRSMTMSTRVGCCLSIFTAELCSMWVKSCPLTDRILSPGCSILVAAPFVWSFVTNIPCMKTTFCYQKLWQQKLLNYHNNEILETKCTNYNELIVKNTKCFVSNVMAWCKLNWLQQQTINPSPDTGTRMSSGDPGAVNIVNLQAKEDREKLTYLIMWFVRVALQTHPSSYAKPQTWILYYSHVHLKYK